MKWMKRSMRPGQILAWLLPCLVLAGCLYPEENRTQRQVPVQQWIEEVQRAVDAYQKETQVLPILSKEAETPIYAKYPIDFKKLDGRYLSRIPENAFENGGPFQYVLIDVETDPTVKLLDLRLSSEVGAVQQTVNRYQSRADELPAANKVGSVYYSIDFEKLNMDKVMVLSPYTNQYLSLIMDENGTVGIHYDFDLAHVMREFEIQASENDRDIRHWLTDHYPFVPIKSFPYVLKDGEPHLK